MLRTIRAFALATDLKADAKEVSSWSAPPLSKPACVLVLLQSTIPATTTAARVLEKGSETLRERTEAVASLSLFPSLNGPVE